MNETLANLVALVESAEKLLDVDDCGLEINYSDLQCPCGKGSIVSKESFNDFLLKLWDARKCVNDVKGEVAFIRKLIGCRRSDCDN